MKERVLIHKVRFSFFQSIFFFPDFFFDLISFWCVEFVGFWGNQERIVFVIT